MDQYLGVFSPGKQDKPVKKVYEGTIKELG